MHFFLFSFQNNLFAKINHIKSVREIMHSYEILYLQSTTFSDQIFKILGSLTKIGGLLWKVDTNIIKIWSSEAKI